MLGSIELLIIDNPVILHMVPDNFPITQEGFLGSDFLRNVSTINLLDHHLEWHENIILFSSLETIVVPARSQTTFYLRLNNPEIKFDRIPRIHLCNGDYLGNAVVTNRNVKLTFD